MAYTGIVSGFILAGGAGNLLGILLVLFTPGYVLVAALFPGNKEIDWVERFALSAGLGLAVVALLGLALNFTPVGIRLIPVVSTTATFTILTGLGAHARRMDLPVGERLAFHLYVTLPSWKGYGNLDRALAIGLAASIAVATTTIAYAVLIPPPDERFTSFFVLGVSGGTFGYPTCLNTSQPETVIVGAENHEFATVNYSLRIDFVGVQVVHNITTDRNETVELNRTVQSWTNFTLTSGQNWTQPKTFQLGAVGFWKIQFLLFKDRAFSSFLHELHMFVRVPCG